MTSSEMNFITSFKTNNFAGLKSMTHKQEKLGHLGVSFVTI